MGKRISETGFSYLFPTFLNRQKVPSQTHSMDKSNLSIWERRIFQMISKEKSNKEISEELHIEVSTVKSHVSSIYSKLGVRSRKELIKGI